MLNLIVEPQAQREAYSAACEWAEDLTICLGWLEGGDEQGPSWDVLEPHLAKLDVAIVGFGFMRSEPALLDVLYERGSLRVVTSTDGGFAPNTFVFRRGREVRVLTGSAPFSSTAHEESIEAMVAYQGHADEPFALQALKLVDRCLRAAHLPTRAELDEYGAARQKELARMRAIFEAPLSMRAKRFHASGLEELQLVTDRETIRRAMVALVTSLERACSWEGPVTVKVRRERQDVWLHWVQSLQLWAAFRRDGDHFTCLFGVDPDDLERLECDFECTIAVEGIDVLATGAIAKHGADDALYLVTRGWRQGRSIRLSPEASARLGGARPIVHPEGVLNAIPVANVFAPDLPAVVAAFGRELKRCLEVLP